MPFLIDKFELWQGCEERSKQAGDRTLSRQGEKPQVLEEGCGYEKLVGVNLQRVQ
jgi:hypothetical protein